MKNSKYGIAMGQTQKNKIEAVTPAAAKFHILCFHGGGGVAGEPATLEPFCKLLCDGSGVSVRLARYRTLKTAPSAQLEDMLIDACQALREAQETAQADGVRLIVLGASFGALLALHAVMQDPRDVDALVLLNPVTNTGSGGFSNRVVDASRHAHLSPDTRYANHPLLSRLRCLIIHGERDEVVPLSASRQFANLWPKGRCEMAEYPKAAHGFFNRPPNDMLVAKRVVSFVTRLDQPTSVRTQKRRLPSGATLLFGIGANTGETGWLQDYLQSHPDCHTPDVKELHYFDVVTNNGNKTNLGKRIKALKNTVGQLNTDSGPENLGKLRQIGRQARYLEIFAARPGDHSPYLDYLLDGYQQQKILCDITPAYSTLATSAFAEMYDLGPVKFIFQISDPVERMWSQIQMIERSAHPSVCDVALLEKCEQRAHELARGGRMAFQVTVDYARSIRALESVVPQSQIHYVFGGSGSEQHRLDEICTFLNIRPQPPNKRGKHRPSPKPVALRPEIEKLMHIALRPQYDFALKHFGAKALQEWRSPPPAPAPRSARPLKPGKTVPTIAFLHIPKTAGQTVVSEIRRVIGEENCSPVRTHTEVAPDAQFPAGYRFYGGHLDWVDLETLGENRFAFTILRDPRERLASFYTYLSREAKLLSEKELQTPQRTGMRMILEHSAEDYFFGGDQAWQGFIHDHYDNFYCTYFITRKIRGWRVVRHLDRDDLVSRALTGAQSLDRVYSISSLNQLETDLGQVLGASVKLVGNYKNAGPDAKRANRWNALVNQFKNPENIVKLEQFVRFDEELIKRLDLGNSAASVQPESH